MTLPAKNSRMLTIMVLFDWKRICANGFCKRHRNFRRDQNRPQFYTRDISQNYFLMKKMLWVLGNEDFLVSTNTLLWQGLWVCPLSVSVSL